MSERRPRWVYDAGDEPDPRFTLANERTFLAWVRTSLALVAGAVALDSLGVPESDWLRGTVVVVLVGVGAGVTGLAFLRWARVERAMRTHEPLPSFTLGLATTVTVVVVAVALGASVVLH